MPGTWASDTLVLSDPEGKQRHVYTGKGYKGKGGDFWGLSIFGASMQLTLISNSSDHENFGVLIDRWTHGFAEGEEDPGIDGDCNNREWRDVECYKDTYPVEYDKARAAVRVLHDGAHLCTSWIASCENHILTNEHCVPNQGTLDLVEFQFEYKLPGCETGTASAELQIHGGTLLEVDEHYDYALIMPELAGNDPQTIYGWFEIETGLPDMDELIYIAHHPGGIPKQLSIESNHIEDQSGRCEIYETGDLTGRGDTDGDTGYFCDIRAGTSGSAVVSVNTLKAVALHHSGNCRQDLPDGGAPLAKVLEHIQASDHPLPPCSWCDPGLAAGGLSASPDGANRVHLDWSAAGDAVEYNIYRSRNGCAAGMEFLGASPDTNYTDATASGGLVYSYQVRAVNACGREADATACEQAETTGDCLDLPTFAGLMSAGNEKDANCSIRLDWSAGTNLCGTNLRYNVYRSRTLGFQPDATNLVASCVESTSWTDLDIAAGVNTHYIVRAEDDADHGIGPCRGGNEDLNSRHVSSAASGADDILVTYDFEGGSTGWTLEGEWQIGAPLGRGGEAEGGEGRGAPDPSAAFQGSGVLGHDLSGLGERPGNYETDTYECATSPLFDASAMPDVILRFQRWLNVDKDFSDAATIGVYDGSFWHTVWQNEAKMRATAWTVEQVGVTDQLAGVINARLRFCLDANFGFDWSSWNVDHLEIYSTGICSDGQVVPVPDGRWIHGAQMTAQRGASAGEVDLNWDTASCAASSYHLLYGDAAALPSYQYTGADCGLNPSGTATASIPDPAPGSFTWWLITGAESARESVHGYQSSGSLRPATGSGFCSLTSQSSTTTCTSCGDGLVTGTEICDGSDLTGQTCKTQGFHSGTLACLPGCGVFDTTSCAVCGDGIREAEESCDTADFGGATCESLGYPPGDLICDDQCSEFFVTTACD